MQDISDILIYSLHIQVSKITNFLDKYLDESFKRLKGVNHKRIKEEPTDDIIEEV